MQQHCSILLVPEEGVQQSFEKGGPLGDGEDMTSEAFQAIQCSHLVRR